MGIAAPEARLAAYPHELSGGMRQRVAIAIALLNDPELVIADEPTTALDVTIQAQILAEVQRLVRANGTALIWITHDLGVVAGLADSISVMYAGRIVERGPVDAVIDTPAHPYTRGLIASLPARNERGRPLAQLAGSPAAAADAPAGCPYRPRCERATDVCRAMPAQTVVAGDHGFRCFHPYRAEARA